MRKSNLVRNPVRSLALSLAAGVALFPVVAAAQPANNPPKPAPAAPAAPVPAAAPAPAPAAKPATPPAAAAPAPAKPAPAPAAAAPAPAKPAPAPAAAAPAPAKPAPAPTAAAPAPLPAAPAVAPPAAAPAVAAKPAALPTLKPAPELDSFKTFIGKWRCEGKQFSSAVLGPEHPIKGSAEAKLESDNFWQSFTYEEKKTKAHPGLKVKGLWGYDQGSKRFVRAGAGSQGVWDTASATGWEGDKLVWTGELSGPSGRVPFHQTFTKKSDREWSHLLEVRGPDGKWSQAEEVTCKK
jgi:hypothetical protein